MCFVYGHASIYIELSLAATLSHPHRVWHGVWYKPLLMRQWVVRDAVHVDIVYRDLVRFFAPCLCASVHATHISVSHETLARLLRRPNEHTMHTIHLHNSYQLRCLGHVVGLVQLRLVRAGASDYLRHGSAGQKGQFAHDAKS